MAKNTKEPVKVDKNSTKPIVGAANPTPILGTFEGVSADADITNHNGMDITRPVWETTFSSEEYDIGIKNGWYIGFLGHPDDPDCQDFEHACIVMTEGHIDSDGKVYGKFNLIDTPVGRVVKAFIDAGVKFGISVRGVGDIVGNSVDPDTFVFRGFDLVAFPAYDSAVPEFTAIAASSDANIRAKYTKVCAAVKNNLDSITSSKALDVIQSQFAKQSNEYTLIEQRKSNISANTTDNDTLTNARVEGMTALYLEAIEANRQLAAENESLKREIPKIKISANRKLNRINQIYASQIDTVTKHKDKILASSHSIQAKHKKLKEDYNALYSELQSTQDTNLIYKRKIESHTKSLSDKDTIIAGLEVELRETVTAASSSKNRTSNLDEKNKALKTEMTAIKASLKQYQTAYAKLYASALGLSLDSLSITASTSIKDLQDSISSSTSTANTLSDVFVEPRPIGVGDDNDDDIVYV